jgi:hypothetical protein
MLPWKIAVENRFLLKDPIDITCNRLRDTRHSFRKRGETHVPKIRSTGKTALRVSLLRESSRDCPFFAGDPIRISSRDPLKLSACSLSPGFTPFLSFRLFSPSLPGKTRRGILVRITHRTLRHIRSINSRSEPLGATNKTVKPFN